MTQQFKPFTNTLSRCSIHPLLKTPPYTVGGLDQNLWHRSLTRDALRVDVSTCSLKQFCKDQINTYSLTNG